MGNYCRLGSPRKGYHAGMPFFSTIFVEGNDAQVIVGNYCRLNGCYIHAKKKIIIGNNCVMAAGISIIDSNGHQTLSSNRTIGCDEPENITIGNNVWVGLNALILKGTTIGDNCIVAAGSVVKGDFSKNSLIVGNPARVVKQLQIEE